ncbi:Prothymosin domain containing protein, partial [Pyrenophora tritici-repentis]
FMPSASNDLQFEYDSPTGLDAEELNALFKLPPRPKNDPRDLASLKTEGIAKSFMWLGIKPKLGLPYDLVHGMEQQQAKDAKKLEKQNDMYDELDEGEQQAKATEEDDETIEARPGKRQKKAMEDDDEAGTKATEDDDESDEARPAKRQTNTFTNSPIKEDIEAAATMLTLRQPVVFANSNQDPGNYNERTDARARAVSTLSAADSQATVSAAETISREPTPTPPARRINTAGATA